MLARTHTDAGDGGLSPSQVQGVSAWAGTGLPAPGEGGAAASPSCTVPSSVVQPNARPFLARPVLGAHSSPGPVALQLWFVSLQAGWEGWGGQGRSGR